MTVWVSLEGLNGVGKTYLADRLAGRFTARLGTGCRLISEITDQHAQPMTGQVFAALSAAGDTFLRGGHPRAETLALLAVKVFEHEHEHEQDCGPGVRLVIEDRGVDTVAVYQAAVLVPDGPVEQALRMAELILQAAAVWRPLPARTLLLVDDVEACLARFADRLQRRIRADELALMHRVHALYTAWAPRHHDRVHLVDRRGRPTGEVLADLQAHCETALDTARTPTPSEADPGTPTQVHP